MDTTQLDFNEAIDNKKDINNPDVNLWITANAGSGKTTQLINRFSSLLSSGIEPEEIICITYTIAATKEIKKRIMDMITKKKIINVATKKPLNIEESQLRIYTIHGLCRALLIKNGHLSESINILNDDEFTLEKIIKTILDDLENNTYNTDDSFKEQINEIIDVLSKTETITTYTNIIKNIVKNQLSFLSLFNKTSNNKTNKNSFNENEADKYPSDKIKTNKNHFDKNEINENLFDENNLFDEINFCDLYTLLPQDLQTLANKTQKIHETGLKLQDKLKTQNIENLNQIVKDILGKKNLEKKKTEDKNNNFLQKLENWQNIVLTNENKPRKKATEHSLELIKQIQQYFLDKLCQTNINATLAVLKLAFVVLKKFQKIKEQKNVITYDDLLFLTLRKISKNHLFRKDVKTNGSNIKQLMLDEAQDTNPVSWQIIYKIIEATKSNFFIVGDEKQSIYRFQGARIEEYEKNKDKFKKLSEKLGKPFNDHIILNTSFRSIQPILDEADRLCNDEATKSAFTASAFITKNETIIKHNCCEKFKTKPKGYILDKNESVKNDLIFAININDFKNDITIDIKNNNKWLNRTEELIQKQEQRRQEIRNMAEKLHEYIMYNKKDCDNEVINNNSLSDGVAVIYPYGTTKDNFIFDVIVELRNRFDDINVIINPNLEKSSIYYIDIISVLQFFVLQNDNMNLSCLLKSEIFEFTDEMLLELRTTNEKFTEINSLWRTLKYTHFNKENKNKKNEKLKFAIDVLQEIIDCNNLDEILSLIKKVIIKKIQTNEKCKKYLCPLQIIEQYIKQNTESFNHYDVRSFLLRIANDKLDNIDNNKLQNTTTDSNQLEFCTDTIKTSNKTAIPKVFFSTIHGVKGMEFDSVLFVDLKQDSNKNKQEKMLFFENFFWYKTSSYKALLNDEKFANLSSAIIKQEEQDEYEKLRLKYVAITRAKRRIVYFK